MGKKREKYFLPPMQEMGSRETKNGGPHLLVFY
jgi:hypothetical protein